MFYLAIPVIGALSVLFIYSFILAKRYQKHSLLKETERAIYFKEKVTDTSEGLWWLLTITISFLTYVGLILYFMNYVRVFGEVDTKDAVFYGMLSWIVVAIVGYRITKTQLTLKDILNMSIKPFIKEKKLPEPPPLPPQN